MMLASALLTVLAATLETPPPPPVRQARAQARVMVEIVQAAEVRNGSSTSPHQRRERRDEQGNRQILLEFE